MAAKRNWKQKEYAARKEYQKAYRRKEHRTRIWRCRCQAKLKCGKGKEVDHKDNNLKNKQQPL